MCRKLQFTSVPRVYQASPGLSATNLASQRNISSSRTYCIEDVPSASDWMYRRGGGGGELFHASSGRRTDPDKVSHSLWAWRRGREARLRGWNRARWRQFSGNTGRYFGSGAERGVGSFGTVSASSSAPATT